MTTPLSTIQPVTLRSPSFSGSGLTSTVPTTLTQPGVALHDGDFAAAADIGHLGRGGIGRDVNHAFAQHDAALKRKGRDGSQKHK